MPCRPDQISIAIDGPTHMVVKARGDFKIPNNVLFSIAGGAFGVLTIGLMVASSFHKEQTPGCATRYMQAGMFAYKRASGNLLRPAELQSKLGGHDWGVLHNVSIDADRSAQSQVAMTVDLPTGGEMGRTPRHEQSGMGFTWQPSFLKNVKAACLSYSVWLPADFKFGHGGVLPGLYGGRPSAGTNDRDAFSARMRWLAGGKVAVQPVTPAARDGRRLMLDEDWLRLERGRWVEIEQEIVLNDPKERNGALRVWIDGNLSLEFSTLAFRKSRDVGFAGVIADTHYANNKMAWIPAPQKASLKLSQLILRWN